MNLSPMSDWRHGSNAPQRLSREAKHARGVELRASHVRVALAREIHAMALGSEKFYAALVDGASEPMPKRANMRGYDIWQFDLGAVAAENARAADKVEDDAERRLVRWLRGVR